MNVIEKAKFFSLIFVFPPIALFYFDIDDFNVLAKERVGVFKSQLAEKALIEKKRKEEEALLKKAQEPEIQQQNQEAPQDEKKKNKKGKEKGKQKNKETAIIQPQEPVIKKKKKKKKKIHEEEKPLFPTNKTIGTFRPFFSYSHSCYHYCFDLLFHFYFISFYNRNSSTYL